jgi:hypothetical protein
MEGDWEEENPNFRSKNGQIVEIERESPRIARVAASERVYLFIITIFFFLFFFWERGGVGGGIRRGRQKSTKEVLRISLNQTSWCCYAMHVHCIPCMWGHRIDQINHHINMGIIIKIIYVYVGSVIQYKYKMFL